VKILAKRQDMVARLQIPSSIALIGSVPIYASWLLD